MATTLTGYSVGTSGVNWFVSADMKTKLGEMSTALLDANVNGASALTFGGGYISRYELIRQLVTKIGYDDQTLKDKITNTLQNKDVTTEEWSQVENWLSTQDVQQPVYKYVNHPYIQNNQDGSYVVDSPARPQEDLFRSGNVVRIKTGANGAMSLGAWFVAEWMLRNSHKYGFFFIGPADDMFIFNPTKKLSEQVAKELETADPLRYWLKIGAVNGAFDGIAGYTRNEMIADASAPKTQKYDNLLGNLANAKNETGRRGAIANSAGRPWLVLAEKY